ncbi:MAG: tRNA (adenosine(37)-N6)-threonylcarbamoyltransferase complex dimerization subunit type 1 TsaB [Caulobacteraceae bacterium]|nr:tRNA (adenosine(37)-N6)-threonylcarbamoyltransferase complex dimerization subunit type 1 TsaB [Caulobacteraceae bacterium]
MNILALDTCVDACSVAVWAEGQALASLSEPMVRGHQERLATMAAEALGAAQMTPAALDRIAVTVGPGSFTGLRVGLAFAKGLGLALGRPVIGVGALEAMAHGRTGFIGACVDARRGRVYLQAFADGRAVMAPDILDVDVAAARIAELWNGGPARLIGSGAPLLAQVLPAAEIEAAATPDPVAVAQIAAGREPGAAPRPLYLRAPDAKIPGS